MDTFRAKVSLGSTVLSPLTVTVTAWGSGPPGVKVTIRLTGW
jgi:hypothetical protein